MFMDDTLFEDNGFKPMAGFFRKDNSDHQIFVANPDIELVYFTRDKQTGRVYSVIYSKSGAKEFYSLANRATIDLANKKYKAFTSMIERMDNPKYIVSW